MKIKYINIDSRIDPKESFWDLNPQLKYIHPFAKLYKFDDSKDKAESSQMMWCCYFLQYPDEQENLFFREGDFNERLKIIKDNFGKDLDWDHEIFNECIEKFPEKCLTSIQKALKAEIESMQQRALVLSTTQYTITGEQLIEGELVSIKKGTAKELDTIRKATPQLIQNYKNIEDQFFEEKQEAIVEGGRRESKAEKGEI